MLLVFVGMAETCHERSILAFLAPTKPRSQHFQGYAAEPSASERSQVLAPSATELSVTGERRDGQHKQYAAMRRPTSDQNCSLTEI
jgi:hypothetical protein